MNRIVSTLPEQVGSVGHECRDSAVSVVTGYGLDDRVVGVLVPVGSRFFSSPCHPGRFWGPLNLLSSGYRGLYSENKAGGARSYLLTSN
jgi:hypothetical protein